MKEETIWEKMAAGLVGKRIRSKGEDLTIYYVEAREGILLKLRRDLVPGRQRRGPIVEKSVGIVQSFYDVEINGQYIEIK